MNVQKLVYWSSTILLIINCLIFLYILYLLLYPSKIIDFYNTPFPIEKNIVVAGDIQSYQLNYCKYIDLAPSVQRSIVSLEDNKIFRLPKIEPNAETGCHIMSSLIEIPKLPSGKYYVDITIEYRLNTLRNIHLREGTETFDIIE